ncbi:glucosidase 2 subunit beta [Zootermopsis nevadensis]|uniref:glucosidase 2 subunit beta n=1 Tax=Zootermopsis nevadensis TaxID=136037 RepID=UPI000B8E79EB|nr:glucosidase 2 subunit beta [Zootermopsis nevadensis]
MYLRLLCLVLMKFHLTKSSENLRLRGVSLSKASLYAPDKEFMCFDGSQTIPFTHVNDDYCDCQDGSDEPGTSACPNGTFHCTNAGHRPLNIPSSRVNDGICDCCDASDEYVSQATCVNNCNELGKAARVEAQKLAELTKLGSEMRVHLSKKGKQLKQEKKERLEQLEKDKVEVDSVRKEKEILKVAVEVLENKALEKYRKIEEEVKQRQQEEERNISEQEAFEHFNRLDANQDGKIEILELQTQQTFDQNRDGAVSEDEAKFFLDSNDELNWEDFLASGWPRMKPFLMLDNGLFKPPATEALLNSAVEVDTTAQESTADFSAAGGEAEDKDFENGHDSDINEEEEEEEEEDEEEEEEGEKTEEIPKYDEETQRLIDEASKARSDFEEADRALRDVQREIRQIEESLEKDYGVEEEFAPLDGECFEYTDFEYTYKLCPFDQVTQRPKSGGADTRLGTWNNWVGPEDDKYLEMMYDKGQSCWNGPQRSTRVKMRCSTENTVTSVSEPNRCEYVFEFETPSICQVVEGTETQVHDEL